MEQLIQKYIKYFYTILIIIFAIQLLIVITTVMIVGMHLNMFALILLSCLNILLLSRGIKFNVHQQFIECRTNLKILRITIIPFMFCQIVFCFEQSFSYLMFINYICIMLLIELILSYRIKCIDHLESLANRVAKINQKGE